MRRFNVGIAIVLFLAATSPNPIQASGVPDMDSLVGTARATLADEYMVLVGGSDRSLVAAVDDFGRSRSSAERLAFAKTRRQFNMQNGLTYERYEVTVVPLSVRQVFGVVELVAEEQTTLYFTSAFHKQDTSRDFTRFRQVHTFTFAPTNWTVTTDELDRLVTDSGGATADAGTQIRGDAPSQPQGGTRPSFRSPAATGYYDLYGAGWYAYTNAWGHNASYRNWHPNDCTDFVSQGLLAGGWQFRQDPFWDWYYVDSGGESNSWVNAYVLRNFTANSGRAYFLSYFEDLNAGDVIFADWSFNGPGIDHSIMVDTRECGCLGGIYVSYHDNDHQHRPLSDLFILNPPGSDTYWAYHITGTQ